MKLRSVAALCTALTLLGAGAADAQTPQAQPLVQAGNVIHLGVITAPSGASLGAGPNGMAVDGTIWYFGCPDAGVAVLTLPPLGGTAQVVSPCAAFPNIDQVHPSDRHVVTGGVLPWLGRVVTSAYVYYDGSGLAVRSHWEGATVDTLSGPFQLGIDRAGMVAGYMGVIPPEWRTLLGGPALTGQCCIPIIGRSSFGPSVSVFDPAHLGALATVSSTMLIGYPIEHQTLGRWDANPPGTYYGGTDQMGSVSFPAGTRSVLFTGRHGDQFCYGPGTGDPALVGTPGPGAYPYCFDPLDPYQGNHGPPYRPTMWAYDANDLLAVKQGTLQPWEIEPYAKWTLPGMPIDGATNLLRAGYYDPATRRLYVGSTDSLTVHVFEITNAAAPPPMQLEVCGDGIDNDFDGLIDEGCSIEECDGIDNDGDGPSDEECNRSWAAPSAPVTLAGTVTGSTASFTWLAPLTGGAVTGYELEAGMAPGLVNYRVPLGLRNQASFADVGTGRYYIRVRAMNSNGSSASSNEVAVSVVNRHRRSRLPRPQSCTSRTCGP